MKRLVLLAVGVAIVLVCVRPTEAQAPMLSCLDLCPDLTIDSSTLEPFTDLQSYSKTDCAVTEGLVGGSGIRRLLRFTTTVVNKGRGALHFGRMSDLTVLQPNLIQFDSCHRHFHILNYTAYRLWTPDNYAQWQKLQRGSKLFSEELLAAHPELTPLTSHKLGWCPVDYEPYDIRGQRLIPIRDFTDPIWQTQHYQGCDDFSESGISPSWSDSYSHVVVGQWVDITGLAAGTYVLESEVNPAAVIEESTTRNNAVAQEVVIE